MTTLRRKIAQKIISQKKQEMKVINNVSRSLEEIRLLPIVGRIKNNWRQRDVTLYAADIDIQIGKLYMVGVAHDGTFMVISYEPIGLNEQIALDYWKHGQKVLVRD